MFLHLALVVATLCSAQGLPRPKPTQDVQTSQLASRSSEQLKPGFRVSQSPEHQPELQYDMALLSPHLQNPTFNYIGEKQHFSRLQPQIIVYNGGPAPDQRFLLQPESPPENLLVPQGGPNVIMRDTAKVHVPAAAPPRPVFLAGFPKPAHIPSVEKDTEEVPTNPAKIPPLTPKGQKLEELETFNDDEPPKKHATEVDVLIAEDHNPAFNPEKHLRPGQRFFILNGQQLFSNFLYPNQIHPTIQSNLKFVHPSFHFIPQISPKTLSPYPNFISRNGPIANIPDRPQFNGFQLKQEYPENLVLLNQPGSFRDNIFKSLESANFEKEQINKAQLREDLNFENFDQLLRLQNNGEQDGESVVIDAEKQNDDHEGDMTQAEDEVVASDKPVEPTIAQAQPGAIALAGPGGVAAAAPRGTAFVGREGVAISSPQATAVAGPRRNGQDEVVEEGNQEKKKQKKRQ